MKILYLSCHATLEHDEVKLLTELGHDVFSLNGSYENPQNPSDIKRPAIPGAKYHQQLIEVAHQSSREHIHPELIEWADTIIFMHKPEWVESNWEQIKHKRVIYRAIGQSIWHTERKLQPFRDDGLQIVRYSPLEKNIPNYAGSDALIRFYKNPDEYGPWEGTERKILTFSQSMKQRGDHCHWNTYLRVTRGLDGAELWGQGNEESGVPGGGQVSYEELKEKMRKYRVYFYTGTEPASYTLNFIEALMTGIPIVALGPKLGNHIYEQDTYEVPEIIKHGESGFVSDDVPELQKYLKILLTDLARAQEIGQAGRARAIELFGNSVKEDWRAFLEHSS